MLAGCLFLLAGAVITLAAIDTASAAAFLADGAVAGAGVGTGFFLGAYRIRAAGRRRLAGRSSRGTRRAGRLTRKDEKDDRDDHGARDRLPQHNAAAVMADAKDLFPEDHPSAPASTVDP